MPKLKEPTKPIPNPVTKPVTKRVRVSVLEPVPKMVDTPTHTLKVKGQTISFIDKKTEEKISKTYPTSHAVRIICGRATGDPAYLHAVIVKIKLENYKIELR